MVSEFPASMANEANAVAENPVERSLHIKKSQGKVPKKIHKAEREKLKRDHLNDLFLELGHALEPARQNNGKASVLGDTARLLRDLLARVESLRRENASLVTESRYVTVEKNELRDENLALEAEIGKLQDEFRGRMQPHWSTAWNNAAGAAPPPPPPTDSAALPMPPPPPPPPVVGPLYVIPLHQELQQPFTETPSPPRPPSSHVRRPHARYPTPSDSWPLQILTQQHRAAAGDDQHGGGDATATDSVEEGSTEK